MLRYLIFALMAGHPKNVQPDKDKFYSKPIWHAGRTAAQGSLIYPGPDKEIFPSIRLAAVRDGLEDYEYFKILQGSLNRLGSDKKQLITAIKDELKIEDDIMPWDWREWTRDVNRLKEKRRRIAVLIAKSKESKSGR